MGMEEEEAKEEEGDEGDEGDEDFSGLPDEHFVAWLQNLFDDNEKYPMKTAEDKATYHHLVDLCNDRKFRDDLKECGDVEGELDKHARLFKMHRQQELLAFQLKQSQDEERANKKEAAKKKKEEEEPKKKKKKNSNWSGRKRLSKKKGMLFFS